MNSVTIIGIVASICTATSMIPQLTKLIAEKKANEISVLMLAILFIGISCWIIYGILKMDWIIITSNSFSILVNFALTILTIKYKNKD